MKQHGILLLVLLAMLPGCRKSNIPRDFSFPEKQGYVNDFAGVMSREWISETEALCGHIEERTGVQVVVVSVQTVEPFLSARSYANALGNEWGIGSEEKNGIVILAEMKTEEIFLACGDAYEKSFHVALDNIYLEAMKPLFEQKAYGEGYYRGTLACGQLLARMKDVELDEFEVSDKYITEEPVGEQK